MKHGGPPGVLLLGVEETPALPILWSLSRRSIPVTVASHRRLCAGMLSLYPRGRRIYPDPARSPDRFAEWLGTTVRSGDFPVTLGCGEEVTWLLSRHKEDLGSATRVPIVAPPIFLKCRDKSLTMKAAAECGVPTPRTWFPEDDGLDAVLGRASYPAVLKPCVSDGARGISYHGAADDLRRTYPETRARYGPCIVQEFIPPGGAQFKAELLLDADSRVRLAGTYAKLRFYPPAGGSSTLNRTERRPDLVDLGARLMTHLRWTGMADCDFIVDPRDGSARLMEVNPRFTRTIRILVEAGLDFPYGLYRLALGEDPGDAPQFAKEDVFLRYLPADLAWFLRSPDRFRARPSFFRFVARGLHYEEWAARDPLTGVGFWGSMLADMLDPAARRRRLR